MGSNVSSVSVNILPSGGLYYEDVMMSDPAGMTILTSVNYDVLGGTALAAVNPVVNNGVVTQNITTQVKVTPTMAFSGPTVEVPLTFNAVWDPYTMTYTARNVQIGSPAPTTLTAGSNGTQYDWNGNYTNYSAVVDIKYKDKTTQVTSTSTSGNNSAQPPNGLAVQIAGDIGLNNTLGLVGAPVSATVSPVDPNTPVVLTPTTVTSWKCRVVSEYTATVQATLENGTCTYTPTYPGSQTPQPAVNGVCPCPAGVIQCQSKCAAPKPEKSRCQPCNRNTTKNVTYLDVPVTGQNNTGTSMGGNNNSNNTDSYTSYTYYTYPCNVVLNNPSLPPLPPGTPPPTTTGVITYSLKVSKDSTTGVYTYYPTLQGFTYKSGDLTVNANYGSATGQYKLTFTFYGSDGTQTVVVIPT